jgi:hypothetical protein
MGDDIPHSSVMSFHSITMRPRSGRSNPERMVRSVNLLLPLPPPDHQEFTRGGREGHIVQHCDRPAIDGIALGNVSCFENKLEPRRAKDERR